MLSPELRVHENTLTRSNMRQMEFRPHQPSCSLLSARIVVAAILGVFATSSPVDSQTPKSKENTAQDSGLVLRQTVRRVRVDVVVTDAQGHPIPGLQASDFRVAEDGKPQAIRQFEYHTESSEQGSLPKRPPLPSHTFINLPEAPERGPLTVVLYDLLNMTLEDQLFAHQQMVEFLKKSSGRRIAVFVLGDQLRLLQGFTSDTDQLVSAVNSTGLTSRKGYDAILSDALISSTTSPQPAQRQLPAEQRMSEKEADQRLVYASRLLDDRVNETLNALVQVGRFLEGMPGRKNLIWYSGSFPIAVMPDPSMTSSTLSRGRDTMMRDSLVRSYSERIKAATNLLNTAEVAVYPVDARGLLSWDAHTFSQRSLQFATMNTIGEQTGGRAFYNTNQLQESLENAAVDGSYYYSLLYAPINTKFDGSLRHISVHLGQKHYHLSYRRSYFARDLDTQEQPDATTPEERASARALSAASQFGAPALHQLVFAARLNALGKPAPATPEQMAALAPYQAVADKVTHRKHVPPESPTMLQQYTIEFGMLASQMEFPLSANGVYRPRLSLAVLAFSADGETLWGTKSQVEDAIPEAKIASIRESGYEVQFPVTVPVNTAVIRLVVRDERRGRTGSMEIRLPLPPDQQETYRKENSGPVKEPSRVAGP